MPHKDGRKARCRGYVAAPNKRDFRDRHVRELIRQGVEQLERQRAGPAQRKFRQALGMQESSAEARAYLALTYALLQQWEKAVAEAEIVLQDEMEHFVSLVALARAHHGAGRTSEANRAALRALRTFYGADQGHSRSMHELALVVDMLMFMEADRRLYQLYRRRVRGRAEAWDPMLLATFGVAAFNCDRWRDARWAWRGAAQGLPEQERLFAAYLFVADMVEQGRIPSFRLDYRLRSRGDEGEDEAPTFLKVFALHTLWRDDDPEARQAALDLLTDDDDEWVAELLAAVVRDPELSDDVKLHAGTMLVELGLVPEDAPLEMHVDGELQPVTIETERIELDLDAATAAFFGEALEADARGHDARAEAGYRAVLDAMPNFVPALLGLAAICENTDRPDEAEELLLKALDAEPFQPLVRLKLAALYAHQDRHVEGWHCLQAVRGAELPPPVRSAYYWLYGRLALAMDDAEAAERAFQKGLQEDPDNDELMAGYTMARKVAEGQRQQWARTEARRRRKYEARRIARDMTWEEGLQGHTVPRLRATARHVGVGGVSSLRKEALVQRLLEGLRSNLPGLWRALSAHEQAALRWMNRRGGVVPYDELCRRFGDDGNDSVDWDEKVPTSVPMRLQLWGLVFVGKLEEEGPTVALLPEETRLLLKFAARRTT